MKLLRLAAGLVLSISLLSGVAFAATAPGPASERFTTKEIGQGFRDGRVLVKLKEGVAEEADPVRQTAELRSGVSQRQIFRHLKRQQVLEFDRARPVKAVIKELMASGLYEFAEEDRVIRAHAVPNDPSFNEQWSLRNTGQSGGVAGADIGAVAGWDVRSSAASVVVGIMDSGIRVTHADLAANVWTNPSPSTAYAGTDLHGINATVTPATGDLTDDEINGHGTHVSGIVGAVGNNGAGISGVAWNVRLMGLKFLDSDGSGSISSELVCFDYAIARGAQIINCSFGAPRFSDSEFAALQRVRDAGIIVVTSAGNDGVSVESGSEYPAGYGLDNIVTVANTTRTDALAGSSNFSSGLVDLAAPGAEIRSSVNTSDTAYTTLSGTSMAAPHVTGTLALMKQHFPGDTYRQLINRLLRSTTKLPALTGRVQSGGRLNLANALASTDNRPINDDFTSRVQLAGGNIRIRSSNIGASRETGEPTHASVAGSASLWWTWTAPSTTTVAFDTTGSSYDTTLAIYTGSALGALTSVATNDNSQAGTTTSRVVLDVTAGTTYQIAVEGKGTAAGYTSLKLGALPANDRFTNAVLLEGRSAVAQGTTLNAGSETGEPKHQTFAKLRSVWYRWIAPATSTFQLAAHSATLDLVAAVYTGSTVSSLTLVGSNDDVAPDYNFDSLVTFTATAGQTYYFAIDDAGIEGGDFTVSINDSIWQFPAELEVLSSPAVSPDGSVYFSADDGWLYAVNANGSEKWQRSIGGFFDVASPAIGADGTIYIGSSLGSFQAFNPSNGARKWSFAAGTGISSTAAIANDGTIYFRDDNTLFALTSGATSATRKWSFPLSGSTYCSPVIAADGTVYVGAANGAFYAVNPDGTEKWKFTADGDIYTSPAIASDGTIYFATLTGKVYALRPDKTQKWVWTMPGNSSVTSSPALGTDGTLYFGGYDHKLHALGSDGVEKWSLMLGEEMRGSSPAIASDGTIYVGAYDSLVYAVNPAGTLQRTYATAGLIRSSPVVTNGRLYFGSSDAKLYAFPLTQNSLSSAWPAFHKNAARTGQALNSALLSIGTPVQLQVTTVGDSATFSVGATGSGPVTYQWLFNGTAIPGATAASYTINNAQISHSGDYAVVVTDSTGSLSSGASLFVKTQGASDARLFAISCRAVVGTDADVLIPGIAIGGVGKQRVVVRAKGPSIIGVPGTLARPRLELYNVITGVKLAENVGWDTGGAANTAAVKAAFAQVGLDEFAAGSADCALLADLDAGAAYTAVASGVGGSTGVAVVEVYELGTSNARMSALSCRARVLTGDFILIPGIIISGSQPKQVIIRASGPALAAQGVAGTLAQLQLSLYNGAGVKVAENIGWSTAANRDEIFVTTPRTGLVNFPANSADCVILVTLPPGGYTAQVSGLNNTTGVALIEVYEVP